MTDTDARGEARVRVLVTEPVAQELDDGRQGVETRGASYEPCKVALEESVAGNARPPRGLLSLLSTRHLRPSTND